jgi:hypothetical protein
LSRHRQNAPEATQRAATTAPSKNLPGRSDRSRFTENGIYVVEDTQTSYWPERGGSDDRHDLNTSLAMLKTQTTCRGILHKRYAAPVAGRVSRASADGMVAGQPG